MDWITRADKDDIQEVTRPHAFKIHINTNSKFGSEFRPELLEALKNLPPERQEALLAKPEQLRHLMNAKDANAVKFYLGRDAEGIDEVVGENVRLAGFQQLHSVPIAKALENTGFTLDKSKIQALNDLIETIHNDDFATVVKYKELVDDISEKCGIPPGNPIFYAAFGLNDEGNDYLEGAKDGIVASIKGQRDYNKDLYSAVQNSRDGRNKEIISTLLRVEKTAPLTDAHITKINDYFKASVDLPEFLTKIGNDPKPLIKGLKAGMGDELTAISFNQLKIQSWAAPLRGTNTVAFNQAVTQMDGVLDNMRAKREPYGDTAVKFQFLADVNPLHLADASFITECKDDPDGMRAKFGGMADQCDLIIDRLLRNQAMLEAQIASLPTRIPGGEDVDEREDQILDLRDRLKEELAETKRNLATFRTYQQKLSGPSGILNAIDDAIANKKNEYYEPASFTTRIVKAGNTITTSPPTTGTAPPLASATINSGSSKVGNFLKEDRLGPGDKCEYEMNHVVTSGSPPTTFKAQGMFVEKRDTVPPAPSKAKGGQIIKQEQCTFVVEQPPTQTHPPRTPQSATDPRLNDAKVNFYMGMAVSILSRFDPKNPPSKDNPIRLNVTSEADMRHLWTALVIVGEKNAKNMHFGRDAIIVESGPFKPANERGMFGFTKESYYSQYKKDYGHIVDAKVTDAKGMAKRQTEHIDSVKHAEKGIDKYKKGMNDIRTNVDDSEKIREEQGAAPEAPTVVFRK